MCCSMLQCVAVRDRALQCFISATVFHSLQKGAAFVLQRAAARCSALKSVSVFHIRTCFPLSSERSSIWSMIARACSSSVATIHILTFTSGTDGLQQVSRHTYQWVICHCTHTHLDFRTDGLRVYHGTHINGSLYIMCHYTHRK